MSRPLGRDDRPGRRYFLAAICGACFLLACGVQEPPRPPRVEQPERVTDLTGAQIGRTLELSFTPPRLTTEGERLAKPLEIEIFRTLTPRGEKPPTLPATADPWVTLLANDLVRLAHGEKITFPSRFSDQEFNASQGTTFTFAIRALTRGFRRRPIEGGLSNPVQITLLDVSGPVENLQLRTTEKALELRWSPPSWNLGGRAPSALSGYRVYRSRTGKPGSFQLLGQATPPTYLDPNFEFDQTYFYKVRGVFQEKGREAESEDSSLLEITPHDTFPPSAPTGLSAIYSAGAIELIWTANTEPDLGGYNVYRRGQEASPQRINTELLRTPVFRDSSVEPGRQYFYRVTAVDLTNNESPRSQQVVVDSR